MCHWKIRKYQEEKILNLMTEISVVNILICMVQTLWLYQYFAHFQQNGVTFQFCYFDHF